MQKREEQKARQLARENERRARKGVEPIAKIDDLKDDDSAAPKDVFLDEAVPITLDLVDAPKLAATAKPL